LQNIVNKLYVNNKKYEHQRLSLGITEAHYRASNVF